MPCTTHITDVRSARSCPPRSAFTSTTRASAEWPPPYRLVPAVSTVTTVACNPLYTNRLKKIGANRRRQHQHSTPTCPPARGSHSCVARQSALACSHTENRQLPALTKCTASMTHCGAPPSAPHTAPHCPASPPAAPRSACEPPSPVSPSPATPEAPACPP